MTLGVANKQGNLLDDVVRFCDEALPERSIYAFLRRERDQLFPDEAFSDLFEDRGRRSVLPIGGGPGRWMRSTRPDHRCRGQPER